MDRVIDTDGLHTVSRSDGRLNDVHSQVRGTIMIMIMDLKTPERSIHSSDCVMYGSRTSEYQRHTEM